MRPTAELVGTVARLRAPVVEGAWSTDPPPANALRGGAVNPPLYGVLLTGGERPAGAVRWGRRPGRFGPPTGVKSLAGRWGNATSPGVGLHPTFEVLSTDIDTLDITDRTGRTGGRL